MSICPICKREVRRMLSCEHTDGKEVCVECYQEIHFLLTEGKTEDG